MIKMNGSKIHKKLLPVIFSFAVMFTVNAAGSEKPLANADKTGLYARSLEQVLNLPPEQIDIATAAMMISERWTDTVYGRRYLTKLDDMIREIRDRLEEKNLQINHKAIPVINKYLFDECNFKSVSEATNPEDLFLHTVLDDKKGYCMSLSILYLSIAERLGLPMCGVVVPGHFFVRYDNGRIRFNIETTSNGNTAEDKYYIKKFNVPGNSRDTIYMTNLNSLQTLGCLLNNLGNVYSSSGNTQAAQWALEKAVEINPSLAESRMNLGNLYLANDDTEDAIYQYYQALEINPEEPKIHSNLANAYDKKGWLNDAIAEYQKALQLEPNFVEVYENMARVYSKQKMFSLAASSLKKAIVFEPKNNHLHNQLGDIYYEAGDYEQAINQYKRALALKYDFAESYYGLGLCYNRLGLFEEEIRAYKKALTFKPEMTAALGNLGNAYFNRQEYDRAIQQYEKMVVIRPADSLAHYNLAAAYFNKGNYEKAETEYQNTIDIDPKMAEAYGGLALVCYQQGKHQLAAEYLRKAQQLGFEPPAELLKALENSR